MKNDNDVVSILICGKVWPTSVAAPAPPTLTVVRQKHEVSSAATSGGRVFAICLGNHLINRLSGMNVEDIVRSKRHYEGYFSDKECEGFLK